jgi:hypothetical protein
MGGEGLHGQPNLIQVRLQASGVPVCETLSLFPKMPPISPDSESFSCNQPKHHDAFRHPPFAFVEQEFADLSSLSAMPGLTLSGLSDADR